MLSTTITLFVTKCCNLSDSCQNCPANCGEATEDELKTVLDAEKAVRWLDRFFPGCPVHISGGEPMMYSDLEYLTDMLVDRNHDVTVFTNASLLHTRPEMYEKPVKWHLTHHYESGTPTELFLKNIEPLKTKPHVVSRLFFGKEAMSNKSEVENLYNGYNFKWISLFSGYAKYEIQHTYPNCPNESILLIGLFGEVFNCSTSSHGSCGNIYDMTFDIEKSRKYRCHKKDWQKKCQPLQTAEIMRMLSSNVVKHSNTKP